MSQNDNKILSSLPVSYEARYQCKFRSIRKESARFVPKYLHRSIFSGFIENIKWQFYVFISNIDFRYRLPDIDRLLNPPFLTLH